MKSLQKYITYINNHLSIVYCLGFVVLIWLMLALLGFEKVTGITIKKTELGENRVYADFPDLENTEFENLPIRLEAYYNDNLPLRNQIIYKYRKLWKNCMSGAAIPVSGSNGHEFLDMSFYKWLAKPLAINILYGKTVELLGKKAFWDINNSDYFVFLAPMKANLYPEFLPEWAQNIKNHPETFYKFFQSKMQDSEFITDLTTVLEKEKKDGLLLFNKKENISHWNGNALDILYKFISNKLKDKPYFTTTKLEDTYKITMDKVNGGIIGDNEDIPWMHIIPAELKLLAARYPYSYDKWKSWSEIDIIENPQVKTGTLLLSTDSYIKATHQDHIQGSFGNIFPLAHNFHYYIHTHFSKNNLRLLGDIIRDNHPDVVIEEFVVRKIEGDSISMDKKEYLLAGELELGEPQLFITPEILNKKSVNITATSDSVKLPDVMPNDDGRVCIMAKITSPVDGKALLYYTQSDNKYIKYNVFEQEIRKGDNYLYMPVYGEPATEFHFKLGFSNNGKYAFYARPTLKEIFEIDSKEK